MFIGHFAAAFASKKIIPRVSLGTMILSAQFIDLVWPIFLVLGIEHVRIDPGNTLVTPLDFYNYPYTHSLLGVIVWSVVLGGIYYALKRERLPALILGLGVLSHWILDLVTHRPDLLLWPGNGPAVGLGLWNSLVGTLVFEIGLFVAGIILYLRSSSSANRIGTLSFWGLVTFLSIVYLANIFGPPPPATDALGYVGLSMWLFVAWGYWIDKNRIARI